MKRKQTKETQNVVEPTKLRVSCHTFVIKDGKVLLGKRIKGSGIGTWGLPGGKLDLKESFWECAKRELLEETGLVALNGTFVQLVNHPDSTDDHYVFVNFLITEWEGEVQNCEPEKCAGWEWFSLDNLPEIFYRHKNFFPALAAKKTFVDAQLTLAN